MSRRPAFASAFAVVLLLVGRFVAFHHEAEVRHVTCEEHGEQLDAPRLADEIDDSAHAHWIGIDSDVGDHHECSIAGLLRMSGRLSECALDHLVTPIVATVACSRVEQHAVLVDVLLIAPKTSPPV
jgi:hypothetical protein